MKIKWLDDLYLDSWVCNERKTIFTKEKYINYKINCLQSSNEYYYSCIKSLQRQLDTYKKRLDLYGLL